MTPHAVAPREDHRVDARSPPARRSPTTAVRLVLAAASGALYAAAMSDPRCWPLAAFTFVPFMIALDAQSPRRGFLIGWLSGVVMSLIAFSWLESTLASYCHVSAYYASFLTTLFALWTGLQFGVHGLLYTMCCSRGWSRGTSLLLSFVASEVFWPNVFPCHFGASVSSVPLLLQSAEWGGVLLVGCVLVCANVALFLYIESAPRCPGSALPWAAAVVIAVGSGRLRMRQIDEWIARSEHFTVGVVQADGSDEGPSTIVRQNARAIGEHLRSEGSRLVIWSETFFSTPALYGDWERHSGARDFGHGASNVFGSVVVDQSKNDYEYRSYNSAVSVDERGRIVSRYDKHILLPLGEYIPSKSYFPRLARLFPDFVHLSPGSSRDPLDVSIDGVIHHVGVLICYEEVVDGYSRDAFSDGQRELIVAMTNDAAFGASREPSQHFALARVRAVEHRRFMVRSANNGPSAIIDPNGNEVASAGVHESRGLRGDVAWMVGPHTLYERAGPWPGLGVASLALVLSMIRRRARGDEADGATLEQERGATLAHPPPGERS